MFSHVVMRGKGRFLFYYFQFRKYLFRYRPNKLLATDGFADQLPEIAEATRGKETIVFQCAFSQELHLTISHKTNAGTPGGVKYFGELEKHYFWGNEVKLYEHHVFKLFPKIK